MKKIVLLAVSMLIALVAFSGCEKFADGCGTLTVTLRNAKSDVVVSVYPYTTDPKPTTPIAESVVRAGVLLPLRAPPVTKTKLLLIT